MKLITLITTTFLALLAPTTLAWDESISEREDPETRLLLSDYTTRNTIGVTWLTDAWQNSYCTNISSSQATRIEVDRWNCGTQRCSVFRSTDCTGEGFAFFSRPLDRAVTQWSSTPWGSVVCEWEDRSSCVAAYTENAPAKSTPTLPPKRW
ncbi:uncharacterized protein N7496_000319 [Penicillium cataractarum]|uniref:Uncharacterized protein n=1 Tax=Penicillium cataractarum TaxID=2100454 RepID=A0A9W9VTU7_9EURO|nr:uncharacterized protein N7496_000319 [Penicillium cataractarum]KAJ5389251.1 hypothetical protein N7496_000319 [Penicillium cataractarum]